MKILYFLILLILGFITSQEVYFGHFRYEKIKITETPNFNVYTADYAVTRKGDTIYKAIDIPEHHIKDYVINRNSYFYTPHGIAIFYIIILIAWVLLGCYFLFKYFVDAVYI